MPRRRDPLYHPIDRLRAMLVGFPRSPIERPEFDGAQVEVDAVNIVYPEHGEVALDIRVRVKVRTEDQIR